MSGGGKADSALDKTGSSRPWSDETKSKTLRDHSPAEGRGDHQLRVQVPPAHPLFTTRARGGVADDLGLGEEFGNRVKPYYEDDSVNIYHGDCREILPQLPRVDLVLTDPPYGRPREEQFSEDFLSLTEWKCAAVILDWRNPLRRADKFGELVWEYGWVSGFRSNAKTGVCHTHNTIHLLGDASCARFTDGSIISRQPGFSSPRHCSFAEKSGHPYEKPVKLMEWLLSRLVGNVVCDPFLGSASTLVAAKRTARKGIGIEIEERYCEIAAKRMAQEVLPLTAAEPETLAAPVESGFLL